MDFPEDTTHGVVSIHVLSFHLPTFSSIRIKVKQLTLAATFSLSPCSLHIIAIYSKFLSSFYVTSFLMVSHPLYKGLGGVTTFTFDAHQHTHKRFSCGMWRLKSKKSIVKLKRVARCHTTLQYNDETSSPPECLFTNAHPHTHRRRPNFESHPDNGKHVENAELSLALDHSLSARRTTHNVVLFAPCGLVEDRIFLPSELN